MTTAAPPAPALRPMTPAEIGKRKLSDLKSLFDSMAPQLQTALPKHMKAERLARIALTACHRTPKLLECTPKSFMAALMTSAQLGLEPDAVVGQAYLIPRKNHGVYEVCLQVGYKGLVELAQRSGRIASISARVVHEGDEFIYSYGLDDELWHRPTGDPEAPITHVYAVVRTTDGGRYSEVMTTRQVEAHRRRYAKDSRDDSAWNTAWDWMAKKTVLIQALKLAPKSVELARAVEVDENPDSAVEAEVPALDLSVEEPAAAPRGLAAITARAATPSPTSAAPEQPAAPAATDAATLPPPATTAPLIVDPAPAATEQPAAHSRVDGRTELASLVREAQQIADQIGEARFRALCDQYSADPDDLRGLGLDTMRGLIDELRAAAKRRPS